ncbi:hypothetical protein B566_EDAN008723 [Ephemera danica]|nr:hypothetical protein B566_EDAN008723 [Ephemera danica]
MQINKLFLQTEIMYQWISSYIQMPDVREVFVYYIVVCNTSRSLTSAYYNYIILHSPTLYNCRSEKMKFYLIFILLITGSIVVSASRPAECLESPAVAGRCDAIVTRFSYYPLQNVLADSGDCDAAMLRYTYYAKMNKCEVFGYGGCAGNKNRFQTLEECTSKCKSTEN